MKLGMGVFVFATIGLISSAWSAPDVKITSLSNAAKNTALEVCGEAKDAEKPGRAYLVRLEHGGANYQSVTDTDGAFCVVLKRRTFDGGVKASVVAPLSLDTI